MSKYKDLEIVQLLDEILEIIKRNDLSIADIAKESGVSASKIYNWNNGRGGPKGEDFVKLQDWLNKFNGTDTQGIISIDVLAAYTIRNAALLNVILDTQSEVLAHLKERPLTSVLREKLEEVNKLEGVLLSEYKSK